MSFADELDEPPDEPSRPFRELTAEQRDAVLRELRELYEARIDPVLLAGLRIVIDDFEAA